MTTKEVTWDNVGGPKFTETSDDKIPTAEDMIGALDNMGPNVIKSTVNLKTFDLMDSAQANSYAELLTMIENHADKYFLRSRDKQPFQKSEQYVVFVEYIEYSKVSPSDALNGKPDEKPDEKRDEKVTNE